MADDAPFEKTIEGSYTDVQTNLFSFVERVDSFFNDACTLEQRQDDFF